MWRAVPETERRLPETIHRSRSEAGEQRPPLVPGGVTTQNHRLILNLMEPGTESSGKFDRRHPPRRTSRRKVFPGRIDDGTDPATRPEQAAGEFAKSRPVLGIDCTEERVIKQQVVRFLIAEGEGILRDEPAPEGTKPTPHQRLEFGCIIDRSDRPTCQDQRFGVMSKATPGHQGTPAPSLYPEQGILCQPGHEFGVRTSQVPRWTTKGIAN